jgi:quercetin dioxygenase-like cupin family protein
MINKKDKAIIGKIADVAAEPVGRSQGASIRILLGAERGMPHFHTRLFTLAPGGRIPEHLHPEIEHEQVVIGGELTISLDGELRTVGVGHFVYIPAGCAHWYENRGAEETRFLCMIPAGIAYTTEWKEPAP